MNSRFALAGLLATAVVWSGCGYVNFNRPMSDEEMILRQEVERYYESVQQAFAVGNPQAFSNLFWPDIVHPMNRAQIEDWAQQFFAKNGRAEFKIMNLDIEEIGPARAVAVLDYRVRTPGGTGDFGGKERDTLVHSGGHWYVSAWDKLSD